MILNRSCFKTKIGTLYYLWLDDGEGPGIAALGTGKDWINGYISFLREGFGNMTITEKKFLVLEKSISDYLNGNSHRISLRPVFLSGTEFERRVWKEASGVPFGCTCSYGDLADMCDRPGAGRAVGNAMRKNPVMLIVPCHRIIKGDGSLGGFGSSPGLKKKLLAIEGTIF